MPNSLDNLVALVTGANRGIGRAVAKKFAAEGAQVILACRDLAAAEAIAAELPNRSRAELVDLKSPRSIEALGARVSSDPGRLDILVNNAGVMLDHDRKPSELDRDVLEQTLLVNLVAPVLLTRSVLPLLKRSEWARVINVASEWGSLSNGPKEPGEANAPSYRISKAALNAYTVSMAAELKHKDILVNSVCPGWVRTDMGGDDANRSPEEAALGILAVALQDEDGVTGKLFRDGEVIPF